MWASVSVHQEDYEENKRQLNEVDKIYYSGWGDEDLIAPRVEKLIADIESVCRRIVQSKRTVPLPP